MLVVDASVAVKFVAEEPGSDAAYEFVVGPDSLIAPDWVVVEVASAIWRKVKRCEILEVHAEADLESLPEFFAKLYAATDLLKEAFRLSFRLRHPVYDCVYLALAIREDARLLTADWKFEKAVRHARLDDRLVMLEWAGQVRDA